MSAASWRDEASCRGADPALFFPDRGGNEQAVEAKRICAGCPVRELCLEEHADEPQGIWGGTSGADRRAAGKPRVLQPCGTVAAARRHRVRGERPCEPCRVAAAEYERLRRAS